jgi:hypothetical protein
MSTDIQIEVAELRDVLESVLADVEAKFGPTVDLAADYYWVLDPATAFDPSAEQASGMTLGQLSDDVSTVREILKREDEPIIIWHDLAHIVGVLSRIAALDRP